MQQYFLAVDGGGTKTEVLCADQSGMVLGRGISGPTNLTSTSVGAASFNLIEAVRQAVETLPAEGMEFRSLVMGLAGIDSQKEQQDALNVFTRSLAHYTIGSITLVNDSVIALRNGTDNPNALVLISGTGSICYGQNASGETARASGMDYLLADQGSGYAIGRRVLREAVKSFDGRGEKTILEQLVCEYFKIGSISELKTHVYNPALDKIEVAQLSPLCSTAYEAGDKIAKEIFYYTAVDIMTMVGAVAKRLLFEDQNFDCVFAGSVVKIEPIREQILSSLEKTFPNATVVFPEKDPVYGALKMALGR